MLSQLERMGLKRSVIASFTLAVFAVMGATTYGLDGIMREAFEDSIRKKGQYEARVVAGDLAHVWEFEDAAFANEELRGAFENEEEDAYVVFQRADGSILASRFQAAFAERASEIIAEHGKHVGSSFRGDGYYGFSVPVPAPAASGGKSAGRSLRGQLLFGYSMAPLERQLARVRVALALFLTGGGLVLLVVLWLVAKRLVFRSIDAMREVAVMVSRCDLTARAEKLADDELGTLAEALNKIGENLAVTLSRVQGVTEGVATVIGRISRTGSSVAQGVGTVSMRVMETGSSMEEMITSLKGIAENVEVLAHSAEESSSSILQMATTNDEVAENIQALAASVEETTAAIEQMTYSIKEVAKNVEDLSATAEETSSSMNEMDVSISQVETNANETAKLSEQAQKDAETGTLALSRTLAGIHKIKGSSKEAAAVIEALGQKIGTVGHILNVIDDVAEQTNLLALNAAILAAQSGEHGKGFAVVADEIKDLAERTGASTKEIAELIRSVQEESKNAVEAMDRGVKNVEEGVRLGQEAESALKNLYESSQKSAQMVKAIARATIEQARGSKQVTMAITRIAETVQQIAGATAEQARGSEQIMKSAEKMKIITKHVERSSQEQARGSKQITKAIEAISEMVSHLNRAQKEQTKGSEQVMVAVEQIKGVADAQTESVRELEAAIVDLAQQAEVLRGEVRRFKL